MIKGRIIKGVGGLYFVTADNNCIYECGARGILRKKRLVPTIGDYVEISVQKDNKGTIESILPRKNQLIRPRVSNIDCAIITFAAKSPSINFDLLDRFLILAEYQKIDDIVICINKCDLAENEREDICRIYSPIYKVIFTSTIDNDGIEELKAYIKGKESVLAGPSGVGKSSLINKLIPGQSRQTGEISRKIERGKHTTRQVELLSAGDNTYIVDSPGFTSLSLEFIKAEELQYYFREFQPYLSNCRFNDCCHIAEPDCGLKAEVGKNVSAERYQRFVDFYNLIKTK